MIGKTNGGLGFYRFDYFLSVSRSKSARTGLLFALIRWLRESSKFELARSSLFFVFLANFLAILNLDLAFSDFLYAFSTKVFRLMPTES